MYFNPGTRRRQFRAAPSLSGMQKAGAIGAAVASSAVKKVSSLWKDAKSAKTQKKAAAKKQLKRLGVQPPRDKPSVKKQLSELKKQVSASNGTLIYRKRGTTRVLSLANQQANSNSESMGVTNLEAVLGQLRFFNPSAPTTLVQASGASATYYREYMFKSIYTNTLVRNNYQIPCKVTVYTVIPREDTSQAPLTTFTNGLADVGNPSSSSPLVFLTDSDEFNDLWKIVKSKSKILLPGEQMHLMHSVKNILYSPATYDSHVLTYQRRFGSYVQIVRVEGCLAHDLLADEQGFSLAGVDVAWETKYEVIYDAGIDLKFIYLDDSADSFTNGAVVSNMPIADNQTYSVA